jgi:circadian clock protein KaiB
MFATTWLSIYWHAYNRYTVCTTWRRPPAEEPSLAVNEAVGREPICPRSAASCPYRSARLLATFRILSLSLLGSNFAPGYETFPKGTMMTNRDLGDVTDRFEQLSANPEKEKYSLRLYVSGLTSRSTEAIATLRAVCEVHLRGRYQLEVIDLFQYPELAENDDIIATPTLVKALPAPLRRLVGDLSDRERILVGLKLQKRG